MRDRERKEKRIKREREIGREKKRNRDRDIVREKQKEKKNILK